MAHIASLSDSEKLEALRVVLTGIVHPELRELVEWAVNELDEYQDADMNARNKS